MLTLKDTLTTFKDRLSAIEYPTLLTQAGIREYGVLPFPTLELNVKAPLNTCQDLFLYARSCPLDVVIRAFGEELTEALQHHEIFLISSDPEAQVKSRFRILWFLQQAILVPYRQYLSGDPVYVGADSFTLFRNVQIPHSASSVLDLFTGSGIQLLLQTSHFSKGMGIDCNPTAIKAAQLNTIMNQLEKKLVFYQKDISQIVEEEVISAFLPADVVLANPPILPVPPRSSYTSQVYSYGGSDGLKNIRQVCAILPKVLHPQGHTNILLCSLGDEKPFFLSEIDSLIPSSFQYTLICLKKIPVELDVFYRPRKERNFWLEHYEELKAKYWFRLLLRVRTKFGQSKYIELNRTKFDFQYSSKIVFPSSFEMKILSELNKKELSIAQLQKKTLYEAGTLLSKLFPEFFPSVGDALRFWARYYQGRQSLAYERAIW